MSVFLDESTDVCGLAERPFFTVRIHTRKPDRQTRLGGRPPAPCGFPDTLERTMAPDDTLREPVVFIKTLTLTPAGHHLLIVNGRGKRLEPGLDGRGVRAIAP
jgi:hypothetical protein